MVSILAAPKPRRKSTPSGRPRRLDQAARTTASGTTTEGAATTTAATSGEAAKSSALENTATAASADTNADVDTDAETDSGDARMSEPPAETARLADPGDVATGNADGLRIRLVESDEGLEMSFEWPTPVAAVAFERRGKLWIVFDKHNRAELLGLGGQGGALEAIDQLHFSSATILRLRLRAGLHPRMSRERAVWRLRAAVERQMPARPITAVRQEQSEGGARFFLPVIDTGGKVRVHDPDTGELIHAVPILPSDHGVPRERDFAEFTVLRSIQGVAVLSKSDEIVVTSLRNGVSVTKAGGLALSDKAGGRAGRRGGTLPGELKEPLLRVADWRVGPGRNFNDSRRQLRLAVARAPKAGRNAARWELARFHFANGMVPETLALLAMIERDDEAASVDPTFRAIRGVSNMLMRHHGAAEEDLMQADLSRYPDALVWRAALHAAQGRTEQANQTFGQGAAIMTLLSDDWRARLLLEWGEVAIGMEDVENFRTAEYLLEGVALSPRQAAGLEYLRGRAKMLEDEPDLALQHFQTAIASGERRPRLRAEIATVDVKRILGQITDQEAHNHLSRLAYVWRGDSHEMALLEKLVDLRLAADNYAGGLALMRRIVINFSERSEAKQIARRMSEVFAELFHDGKADALQPVRALALYYDYQELTPVGAKGDEMIRRLADRLVGVDLLDRAARLLEAQVAHRLKGRKRAQVATRLALIYLFDRRPREALEALRQTGAAGLPGGLAAERRLLEARALADLNRTADALATLRDDRGDQAAMLRAEIAWRAQNWPEVAGMMRQLVRGQPAPEGPLDAVARANVVKLAVALYMSQDRTGLGDLTKRFGAAMAEGEHAETFRMLTHTANPNATEFRQLASAIAGIGDLEAFMSSYRRRLANGGLSAIN